MPYLQAFTDEERLLAKKWLATQVASMMGRKLEEGDWSRVYCLAKGIPERNWSNLHIDVNHLGLDLHIDVNHLGLGLEMKLLRIGRARLGARSLKTVCGETLMHPSATRSIRVSDTRAPADDVMRDVFRQYADLIAARTDAVRRLSGGRPPDMRTGWMLWEDSLTEFLYFEESMLAPDPDRYTAEWNVRPAQGVRKESINLWIYDRESRKKRFSVTTSAGVKIQPYFDVPLPSDPGLNFFRVQSEALDDGRVRLWISAATARSLRERLGSLDCHTLSDAMLRAADSTLAELKAPDVDDGLAVAVEITGQAHAQSIQAWEAVSDEHRAQLLLKALVKA